MQEGGGHELGALVHGVAFAGGECWLYHDVAGEEVRAAEHDHYEPDGEEERAESADQTGRVGLVPRRGFGAECYGTPGRLVSKRLDETCACCRAIKG